MSTLVTTLIIILGLFPYLFFYWRRLKEDYGSPQIFVSALIIFLGIALGVLISIFLIIPRLTSSAIFEPAGLWFWGATIGFISSLLFVVYHRQMKFFETFEANAIGLLILLFLIFLKHSLITFSLSSALATTAILGLIFLFFFLDSRYKKFTWYRSGKVGFSGLVTLGLFFLLRATVAVRFGTMLSLSGRVEIVASSVAAFLLFFAVYNLAELK